MDSTGLVALLICILNGHLFSIYKCIHDEGGNKPGVHVYPWTVNSNNFLLLNAGETCKVFIVLFCTRLWAYPSVGMQLFYECILCMQCTWENVHRVLNMLFKPLSLTCVRHMQNTVLQTHVHMLNLCLLHGAHFVVYIH